MARKKEDSYFDRFVSLVDYSCEAAAFLQAMIQEYDPGSLEEKCKDLHAIEHQADIEKHLMMQKLAKEFITPIEREDIMTMAHEIDNVTDAVEDVAMQMYMFNIRRIREDALEMIRIILECCEALRAALKEFHNFRKSEEIHKRIVEVNRLEEEGDRIFTRAMRKLYTEQPDLMEVIGWTKIFERLENCCDTCENVSDVIESVIMKNT